MSIFTKLGADIAAPTDAAGAPRKVVNGEFQTWMTEVERLIQIATGNGDLLLFNSKDDLDSSLNHPANTGALLIGESIADDGLYMKQGASGAGSWVKIGGVPGQGFVKATNTGTGTSTAIEASTPVAVNETQLILLPIAAENAGSPVTVSFNGGSPLTIKTVSGSDVAAGGLPASSVMLGTIQGSTFRLLSDQASAAIQAAAEAARDEAVAAASSVQSKLESKAYAEANYHPVLAPDFIETAGYATAGDGGGALYKKVLSEPSHAGKFSITLDDGVTVVWYELCSRVVVPQMFGAVGDAVTDDIAPLEDAVEFLNSVTKRGRVLDLFGKQYAISRGLALTVPCMKLQNGSFTAIGTAASWGSDFMVYPSNGAYRVRIDAIDLYCNFIANGVTSTDGPTFRGNYVNVYNFKDRGIVYDTHSGCHWSHFSVDKWRFEKEASKLSANTGVGLYLAGVDGRFHAGTVAGGAIAIQTTPSAHHLLVDRLHGWNSSGQHQEFIDSGTGPFAVTNFYVDSVDHVRVRIGSTVLVKNTDYTITLDANGAPTITLVNPLGGQELTVSACLPDVISWQIQGYACSFENCYFDNGYVKIYNPDNRFTGTSLYLEDYVKLTSHVRMVATEANQKMRGNLMWDVIPRSNLKVFNFVAEPGASWDIDTAITNIAERAAFSTKPFNWFNNSQDNPTSIVARFLNTNNSARVQFKGAGATGIITAGSDGDDFAVQTNGTTRMKVGAGGVTLSQSSVTFDAPASEGATVLQINTPNAPGSVPIRVDAVGNGYGSAAAAATLIRLGKNTSTNRSINAGGTVNASGSDYAEYVEKAEGCGEIAKGQVCGINAEGKITDKYDDAHTFVIKSSDPSFVGGDSLVPEDGDTSNLDRIAFCGRVPVLIDADVKPGQFLEAFRADDGKISVRVGSSQSSGTVGKVWSIEDGVPIVAVLLN